MSNSPKSNVGASVKAPPKTAAKAPPKAAAKVDKPVSAVPASKTTDAAPDAVSEANVSAKLKKERRRPKKLQASKDSQMAASGGPVKTITDDDGSVLKVIMFADDIEAAFGEALSEGVSHPQGNVDDQTYWPDWAAEVRRRLALKLGIREAFIGVSFHVTDRLGQALPADGNLIRVSAKVGDQIRHTLLSDPTPED